MEDDERTTHVELAKLADLVERDDPRRRVLENLDAIAQMAIDAEGSFMGKSYPAPELQTAIKAQIAMAAILSPEFEKSKARQPVNQNSIVEAIRRTAIEGERLRLLGAPALEKRAKEQAE